MFICRQHQYRYIGCRWRHTNMVISKNLLIFPKFLTWRQVVSTYLDIQWHILKKYYSYLIVWTDIIFQFSLKMINEKEKLTFNCGRKATFRIIHKYIHLILRRMLHCLILYITILLNVQLSNIKVSLNEKETEVVQISTIFLICN